MAIQTIVKLVEMECGVCGIPFAMPQWKYDRANEGNNFYCPNGHALVFTSPEIDKLRKQLNNARSRMEMAEADAAKYRDQRDGALRQVSIKKGQITKLRKRAQAGVCSECHRHFENVERHMKSKHPE